MRITVAAVLLLLATSGAAAQQRRPPPPPPQPAERSREELETEREKETRDLIERKIDSQLLRAIDRPRLDPMRRSGRAVVEVDKDGRALVEIRARLAAHLIRNIERMKGTVVSASLQHRSVIAWVPLRKLTTLAKETSVTSIDPAPQARSLRPSSR